MVVGILMARLWRELATGICRDIWMETVGLREERRWSASVMVMSEE